MLKLDVSKIKEYEVQVGDKNGASLTVKVVPITKRKELEIEKKHTKKRIQFQQKKGFNSDTVINPSDIDRFGVQLETAQLSWKGWDLQDEKGVPTPCTAPNIEYLFINYYEEWAWPVLDKLDKMRLPDLETENEDRSESEKN